MYYNMFIGDNCLITELCFTSKGHPFMQSIKENKGLMYSLLAVAGITVLAAAELMPEFNTGFELVLLPFEVRSHIFIPCSFLN